MYNLVLMYERANSQWRLTIENLSFIKTSDIAHGFNRNVNSKEHHLEARAQTLLTNLFYIAPTINELYYHRDRIQNPSQYTFEVCK